jgi:hypothetical protein
VEPAGLTIENWKLNIEYWIFNLIFLIPKPEAEKPSCGRLKNGKA